ncbi:hypothetical protein [Streptomyces purpureus]|uniref:hypothetical protein n=1 Tax=Streptomyces purpureus TaxID=1951 RepID=UPI001B7FC835|nr:hypothetical protein [Streptomyces purpureus]
MAVTVGADAAGSAADAGGAKASVSRTEFTEAAPSGALPAVTGDRKAEMFAEHPDDAVSALRFVITVDGRVAEERLWRCLKARGLASVAA